MIRRLIAALALVAGLIGTAQVAQADALCARVTVLGAAESGCVGMP